MAKQRRSNRPYVSPARLAAEAEFRALEAKEHVELHGPAPVRQELTADELEALEESATNQRVMLEAFGVIRPIERLHPDKLGVYRQPEPKSIYSPVSMSRVGSMPKPKISSKVKGNEGGKVKLWQGNTYGQLDPYMYRTAGRPTRK